VALAIWDELYKAEALGRIATELGKAGDRDGLAQTLAAAQKIENKFHREKVLGEIAWWFAQTGDETGLACTLSEVQALRGGTIIAEASADHAAKAMTLVREREKLAAALAAAQEIQDDQPRVQELSRLAPALARAGMKEKAELAAGQVLTAIHVQDGQYTTHVPGGVVQALLEIGDSEILSGVMVVQEISNAGLKVRGLSAIAQSMARMGMAGEAAQVASQALAAAQAIQNKRYRAEALSRVFQALIEIDPDQAWGVLVEAVQTARLDGRDVLFEVIGRVAPTLATLDDGQTLLHAYQEIMKIEAWWGGAG
jgi:hypothetical protein